MPLNAIVERVARPAFFTKTDELNVSTSAMDKAMFSFSAMESNVVFCTPISCIGRRAVITNSSRLTTSRVVSGKEAAYAAEYETGTAAADEIAITAAAA